MMTARTFPFCKFARYHNLFASMARHLCIAALLRLYHLLLILLHLHGVVDEVFEQNRHCNLQNKPALRMGCSECKRSGCMNRQATWDSKDM